MMLQEFTDDLLVLLHKNGTSCVKQFNISCQQSPQRAKNMQLLLRKALYVCRATQPFYIGMAAHYSGSGAGHIGKNALERLAVPPIIGLPRISAL